MTNNPLARRRETVPLASGQCYANMRIGEAMGDLIKTKAGFASDMVDMLNAGKRDQTLEYFVKPDGISWGLRVKPEVAARRLREEREKFEQESQRALHRDRYPVTSERGKP